MRHFPFLILLSFLLFSCDAGINSNNGKRKATLSGLFLSKSAIGFYGIAIGLAIGILGDTKKKYSHKKRRASGNKIQTDNDLSNLNSLRLTLKQQEDIAFGLERKLKDCESEKSTIKRQLDEAERLSETKIRARDLYHQNEAGNKPEFNNVTTDYYLKPSKDGTFKESSKVNKVIDALYELTYQNENPTEATLAFVDSSDNVFGALQNETTWLLVVCERSNFPTPQTRSIRTDQPGRAVFKNGEWQIVQKAKITYI